MVTHHAKSWCAAPEAQKAPPIMGVSLGQSGATPLYLSLLFPFNLVSGMYTGMLKP